MAGFVRVLTGVAASAAMAVAADGPVRFNRDIRPIMSDTCFRCHGPDKGTRMAGLRLDLRDEALKPNRRGAVPIVPGDPDKSLIVQRVFASNPARLMPPAHAHKELTDQQKQTIRRWVAEGARYEGHWAYEPVRRPAVPDGIAPHPVDAFVQARLRQESWTPAPEADRRTLIRRVTLDLTGLPPTPQEVSAFVRDRAPNAYETLVDRLLASPRYAERQAMHWLDAVRYSDSAGFHGDNPVPAWPYRDYVLRAFRDNKSFDQFTREQLAGDLLPDATAEQKVASAFNRLNRVSAEGGLQPKEYLAKYAADRVRTVSSVWLGATMGCAECHDHKFDPILTKDFYAMKAFFADIVETGLVRDRGPEAWGTKLALPTDAQRQSLLAVRERLADARQALDAAAERLATAQPDWERALLARHQAGDLAWRFQRPIAASAKAATLTVYNDEPVESNYYVRGSLATEKRPGHGLVVAGGANPDNETYTVQVRPGAGTWTSLGIDVQQDEGLPGVRVARGADRYLLTEVEAELGEPGGNSPRRLPLVLATSSAFGEMPENSPMAALDGSPKTGWGMSYGEMRSPFLALRFERPVATTADTILTVRLRQDADLRKATIGRFRLALSSAHSWPESGDSNRKVAHAKPDVLTLNVPSDLGLPVVALTAFAVAPEKRDLAQRKAILEYLAWATPDMQPLLARVARLEAEKGLLEASIPQVIVTEATLPEETRILPRANWMDDTGAIVEPAVPEFLGRLATPGRATRLDLANWITSPGNPLTARVYANRLWRQLFGNGLSKVLDDLGSQGELPTHPELLDWLAMEFMQPSWRADGARPWDMRHLVRTIVTSHAYRQHSQGAPQVDERDPDNRLLARQSRVRVDAEAVRDIALAVSGLLTERFGGPSVKPYQPAGYYTAMNFPKREYSASRGEDLYRRGVYTHWQRTFLHPSLMTFDAPTREECTVTRVSSNTPLQALVLLNDPAFVEASRVFAQNALAEGGPAFQGRLTYAFQRALSRPPRPEERQILAGLYRKSLARFQAAPAAAREFVRLGEVPVGRATKPAELAAMATVTRAILNLHETITRN